MLKHDRPVNSEHDNLSCFIDRKTKGHMTNRPPLLHVTTLTAQQSVHVHVTLTSDTALYMLQVSVSTKKTETELFRIMPQIKLSTFDFLIH